MLLTLVLVAAACTVARARHRGIPWEDIRSFPSQWFNWVFFGRDFSEPFSAYVGSSVHHKRSPRIVWVSLEAVLDTAFRIKERNHCAAALRRLEEALDRLD